MRSALATSGLARSRRYGDIRKTLRSAPAVVDADRSLPVPASPHDWLAERKFALDEGLHRVCFVRRTLREYLDMEPWFREQTRLRIRRLKEGRPRHDGRYEDLLEAARRTGRLLAAAGQPRPGVSESDYLADPQIRDLGVRLVDVLPVKLAR